MPAALELTELNAIVKASEALPCGRSYARVNVMTGLTPGESETGVTVVGNVPFRSEELTKNVAKTGLAPEPKLLPTSWSAALESRRSGYDSAICAVAAKQGEAGSGLRGLRRDPSSFAAFNMHWDFPVHTGAPVSSIDEGTSCAQGSSSALTVLRTCKLGVIAEKATGTDVIVSPADDAT